MGMHRCFVHTHAGYPIDVNVTQRLHGHRCCSWFVQVHGPEPTISTFRTVHLQMSDWEQHLCNCCIPIDIHGTAYMWMQVKHGPTQAYALVQVWTRPYKVVSEYERFRNLTLPLQPEPEVVTFVPVKYSDCGIYWASIVNTELVYSGSVYRKECFSNKGQSGRLRIYKWCVFMFYRAMRKAVLDETH